MLLQLKPNNVIDTSPYEAKLEAKKEVNIYSPNGRTEYYRANS
jgi:hypothetical protein